MLVTQDDKFVVNNGIIGVDLLDKIEFYYETNLIIAEGLPGSGIALQSNRWTRHIGEKRSNCLCVKNNGI